MSYSRLQANISEKGGAHCITTEIVSQSHAPDNMLPKPLMASTEEKTPRVAIFSRKNWQTLCICFLDLQGLKRSDIE